MNINKTNYAGPVIVYWTTPYGSHRKFADQFLAAQMKKQFDILGWPVEIDDRVVGGHKCEWCVQPVSVDKYCKFHLTRSQKGLDEERKPQVFFIRNGGVIQAVTKFIGPTELIETERAKRQAQKKWINDSKKKKK